MLQMSRGMKKAGEIYWGYARKLPFWGPISRWSAFTLTYINLLLSSEPGGWPRTIFQHTFFRSWKVKSGDSNLPFWNLKTRLQIIAANSLWKRSKILETHPLLSCPHHNILRSDFKRNSVVYGTYHNYRKCWQHKSPLSHLSILISFKVRTNVIQRQAAVKMEHRESFLVFGLPASWAGGWENWPGGWKWAPLACEFRWEKEWPLRVRTGIIWSIGFLLFASGYILRLIAN